MKSNHRPPASFLQDLDFFSNQQFFTFTGKTKLSSPLNIFCSLVLWIIIIVFLAFLLSDASRGKVKMSSQSFFSDSISSKVELVADGKSFMMAIQSSVFETSASASNDIIITILRQGYNSTSKSPIITPLATQKCTIQHWKGVPDIENLFSLRNIQNWMCVSLNSTVTLQGLPSSQTSQKMQIFLSCASCTGSTAMKATLHLLNPVVNLAQESNYIHYGIDSRNYLLLDGSAASYLNIEVQNYEISSDSSSMPWSSKDTMQGAIISDLGQKQKIYSSSLPASSGIITVVKSQTSILYVRETYTTFDAFAFIGGLFLFLLCLLFIFRRFGQSFFKMSAAVVVYNDQQSRQYNFRYYLAQTLSKVLKPFGLTKNWQTTEHFNEVEQQVACLRDIHYMEQRLHFLQSVLPLIFQKHQLKALHLIFKPNLSESYQKYQAHQIRSELGKYFSRKKEQRKKRSSSSDYYFGPNCAIPKSDVSIKRSEDDNKMKSESIEKCMKFELNLGGREEIETENSTDMRMQNYLNEYLKSQNIVEGQKIINEEEILETVRVTKSQLELLQLQASTEGYSMSKKLYQQLAAYNSSLLYLLQNSKLNNYLKQGISKNNPQLSEGSHKQIKASTSS